MSELEELRLELAETQKHLEEVREVLREVLRFMGEAFEEVENRRTDCPIPCAGLVVD